MRRVNGAEFKTQVLAECQQLGTSVAAIALAHGLNVSLLRNWAAGRGIQRTWLAVPRAVTRTAAGAGETSARLLQHGRHLRPGHRKRAAAIARWLGFG